jgi:lipoate-protein ligase A
MNNPTKSLDLDRAACDSAASANTIVPETATRIACFYDPPSRGTWNMALDDVLLLQAAEGGPPTLRFYEWDQPTLSLGYFQRYGDRALHQPSVGCPLVRRTTGGGAILHDHELTYSCAMHSGHRLTRRAADLYYAIHESIVSILAQMGLVAHLQSCDQDVVDFRANVSSDGCGATETALDSRFMSVPPEPFLCFQRRTAGDVIFNNQKIAGSAQRRCRGAVLQHGSILLARSQYAPELPGIHELGCRHADSHDLALRLRAALSDRLKLDFVPEFPSRETLNRAMAIETAKFAEKSWQQKR